MGVKIGFILFLYEMLYLMSDVKCLWYDCTSPIV